MIPRRKIVLISVLGFIVLAFYLQMAFNGESFRKNDFAKDDVKGVISGSGSTFVENGTFEGNDFFAKAKLDREIAKGQSKDTAKEIMGNVTVSPDGKQAAMEKISKLTEISEQENKIETLVKEKGFSDVFAAVAQDGSLDMIVKAPSLTGVEVAQLADIASRHANIPMNLVHIKNKF